MDIAGMTVESADTKNDISKIEESNHKLSLQIMKKDEERAKLSDEIHTLNEMLEMVQHRIHERNTEYK